MEDLVPMLRKELGPGYWFLRTVPVWDSYRIWVQRADGPTITVDVPDVMMDRPLPDHVRALADTIRSAFGELPPEAGDHARYQPRRV